MNKNSNYYRRLAKGLCGACGQKPIVDGKTHCAPCQQYSTLKSAELRTKRVRAGLCRQCGSVPRIESKSCCTACLLVQADKAKVRRYEAKISAFDAYGGRTCACCGESNIRFLTIDHIDGGGNEHRKAIGVNSSRGSLIYTWLAKNNYPGGFQVLCFNCNCGRAFNGGICPHKTISSS